MNRRVTWLTLLQVALVVVSVCASAEAQTPAPPRPQHAILLVIDGLSYLAPERVDMPNLKALMARGRILPGILQRRPAAPAQRRVGGELRLLHPEPDSRIGNDFPEAEAAVRPERVLPSRVHGAHRKRADLQSDQRRLSLHLPGGRERVSQSTRQQTRRRRREHVLDADTCSAAGSRCICACTSRTPERWAAAAGRISGRTTRSYRQAVAKADAHLGTHRRGAEEARNVREHVDLRDRRSRSDGRRRPSAVRAGCLADAGRGCGTRHQSRRPFPVFRADRYRPDADVPDGREAAGQRDGPHHGGGAGATRRRTCRHGSSD